MKKFFKLDFKSYIKPVVIYYILHIANVIILSRIEGSRTMAGLVVLLTAALVVSPFIMFFKGNNVAVNIRLLRNSFYSKHEIFLFYILSRVIRFFIIVFPILFYLFGSSEILDRVSNDFDQYTNLFSTLYWEFFLGVTITIVVLFVAPLWHNPDTLNARIQKNSLNKVDEQKQFRQNILWILGFIALFFIVAYIPQASVNVVVAFQVAAIFLSFLTLQNLFLFVTKKTGRIIYASIILLGFIYFTFILISSRSYLKSRRVSLTYKEMYLSLGEYAPRIKTSKINKLLLFAKNLDEKNEIIDQYTIKRFGFENYVNYYLDEYNRERENNPNVKMKLFYNMDVPRLNTDQFKFLVRKLSDFYGRSSFSGGEIPQLHGIIMGAINVVDKEYLNEIFQKYTPFTDYCSAELVFHHFGKAYQKEFLVKNYRNISYRKVLRAFGKRKRLPKEYLDLIDAARSNSARFEGD